MTRYLLFAALGLLCGFAGYLASQWVKHPAHGPMQLKQRSTTTYVPTRADRYTYLALIVRVVDGDTVDAEIDLGFHTWRKERLRLNRINAPEPKGATREEGKAATNWLREHVEGQWLIVRTIARRDGRDKQGKYGRYLIEIFKDNKSVNDEIVNAGHAIYR